MKQTIPYVVGSDEVETEIKNLTQQLYNNQNHNQIKSIVTKIRQFESQSALKIGEKIGYTKGFTTLNMPDEY